MNWINRLIANVKVQILDNCRANPVLAKGALSRWGQCELDEEKKYVGLVPLKVLAGLLIAYTHGRLLITVLLNVTKTERLDTDKYILRTFQVYQILITYRSDSLSLLCDWVKGLWECYRRQIGECVEWPNSITTELSTPT